jgi:hypothetical protein
MKQETHTREAVRSLSTSAADFLIFDEALCMHEALKSHGFELRDRARAWKSKSRSGPRMWIVRLVWRRRTDNQSAVLSLRISVPGAFAAPASGRIG